ncbi:MAG: hypothetical protein VX252_13420 [Myxococcota bacterium]|nr:hypothetical protein [Myxococcota bacterium]
MTNRRQRWSAGLRAIAFVTAVLLLPALQSVHAHNVTLEHEQASLVDQAVHSGDLTAECVLCLAGASKVGGPGSRALYDSRATGGVSITQYDQTLAFTQPRATGNPRSPPQSI